ncbi:MAG TPA: EAL domain-containing protein [Thermoanaerobaculia bacterium]|nr:EAL domain-containing protein [Thermoanaerobaculia bacterium]
MTAGVAGAGDGRVGGPVGNLTLYVLAGYLGQTVWSLVVAVLLAGFHRTYRRHYLGAWALCWGALAVHQAANALGFWLVGGGEAAQFVRPLLSAASLVAIYVAVVWLLVGSFEVATGHIVGRHLARRSGLVAIGLGLVSAVAYVTWQGDVFWRHALRIALPQLVTGVAFLVAAAGAWWLRRRHGGRGPAFAASAFALYGLLRLYVGLESLLSFMASGAGQVVVLTIVELLLLSLIALAMAVWLFEEERRRAIGTSAQLERLASYDPLTELMNRPALFEQLDAECRAARSRGGSLLVALLNVDRFKAINDSFGQAVGDDLLRRAGWRLRLELGAMSAVARLAGAEFVVLSGDDGLALEPEALAAELQSVFEPPFELAGREIQVSATIGVSCFPDDGETPEELVRHASLALVEAREQEEPFRRFTPPMSHAARERLSLELDLRRALEAGELDLAYQPLVTVTTGIVERVEALARWRRADGDEVRPFRFLAIAELIGLAEDLDAWVLSRALAQLADWRAAGHGRLRMAVNLSAVRFRDPQLAGRVEEALRNADVPAERLDLEITERAAMHQAESSLHTLNELKALGVGLTIDDFGTGYSSLAYLRRLPVDTVKIDRSFIEDLAEGREAAVAIVRAVIALGRSLGLSVVAEGVETGEQWEVMTAEGCHLVQGFYVSPPLDATACGELLRHGLDPPRRAMREMAV